jgi:ATP-dependent helicase/nuclease subunit A
VKAAIERLMYVYPHDALTGIRAAASVTSLTKSGRFTTGGVGSTTREVVSFERVLALPRFITEHEPLTGAEVGTITHTVLQHIDLSRSCDPADLKLQVEQMVERRFIRARDVAKVSFDAILWLMQTPLARMLCQHRATLLRELELVYPQSPDDNAVEPADMIMVRGRIDAIVVEPDGLTLIDYKTDRVTSDTVDARAEFYRPQVQAYRDHLEKIVKRRVKAAYLVFLSPRLIRSIIQDSSSR